ncbi:helix-turn-helix domain-containing protein [Pseudomonas sp. LPB0260]|uniref:GlxA family transcriptional regulator n=1 Tax=Pseudomonas sp. LPB0260 TaxID=2614442 RepID=UPI0015C2215A|nr:helix-turn-helix domain-containing protein [Pseudomonas sp. LPB0260]QLC73167.1 helix-turn-helix domain-containing protein [Pseudomonas sp. LPB0260]QLC75941.1 helix-turn-helix domain-containing protein [Pseudomonas sp. LPB0260]
MKVTVLMADRCSATSVSAALEFLECANVLHGLAAGAGAEPGRQPFAVQSASIDGAPVTCTGGLRLTPSRALAEVEQTDLIIVPGFMFNILSVLPGMAPVSAWLQHHHRQGAYIASMCTGSFVTAQAGLLDGRRATTHWIFSEQFARHFPKVQLQAERSVTDDGLMLCSAGSTTGSDLLLHIIRRFASPQLAAECSKKMLVDSAERLQTPYMSPHFDKTHQDVEILKIQIWLEKRLGQPIVLEQLADQFALSLRNMIRRFKEATGQTPGQYLQNLRIERAKHLLEAGAENFDRITQQVGYEDASSFRRLFKERVGISPGAYRRRFNSHYRSGQG